MISSSPKILIIDDSQADRELIARMVATKYVVLEAANVDEGLALYLAEKPDCVLLDHFMPGTHGLDALVTFVKRNALVVVMTGAGSDELAAEAFKRGARDYLLKKYISEPVLQRIIARELERRRLELDLQATRERFDEVASRIAEVLWVRSLDGEFLYLSPAFEQVWGVAREGITLQQWEEALHPEDRARKAEVVGKMRAGEEYESEFRIVRPDGQIRRIHNRGYPIFEDGQVARIGGIARDITDEVRMHAELRLAQKLEAIGQLAAGVAHEINTPAQYVSDNITFLSGGFKDLLPVLNAYSALVAGKDGSSAEAAADLKQLAENADLKYLIDEIPTAIQQAAVGTGQIKRIVMAMKEFSHPSDDMKAINLNRAIESTVTVAKNEWKYVAEMKLDLAEDLPLVACYPSELNQVVLNLIVNAAHAIGDVVGKSNGEKGEISISTRVDGKDVIVAIADTGGGIPEAIREKVFDPFFTTKEIGRGTGQGLAIAHRIVNEHHGGTIEIDSQMRKGTRFLIRLPINGAPQAEGVPDKEESLEKRAVR